MRSIRWSLVAYFLLLLGAALGAVSYFSYQSTQSALAAKEKSTKESLINKSRDDKIAIAAQFDLKVFDKARTLGQKLTLNYHRIEPLYILGVVASAPHSGGLWNILPWSEAQVSAVSRRLYPMNLDPRIQPLGGEDDHLFKKVPKVKALQAPFARQRICHMKLRIPWAGWFGGSTKITKTRRTRVKGLMTTSS
jgi:hypothetical protein